ncbi:MAG TPA: hypothetical protein VF405_00810 [Gammaproteobacteria bacterium]
MDLPSFAINAIVGALAKWMGTVTGAAASRLIDSVRVAEIQLNVARGLVGTAEQHPGLSDEDRRKLLDTAAELVREARADVRRAATGVALAVPREVEAAFDNFAASAAAAAGAVAQQAKETAVWYFVIAAAALYFLGQPGGPLHPKSWR